MRIVGIDLGKSKSVVCELDSQTGEVSYEKIPTTPVRMRELLQRRRPDQLAIEIGSQAGWVSDLAESLGLACEVANTNHETWQWKRTRTKTDRRDALRLAKLSLLGELPTVPMPSAAVRQKRSLIKYRHQLVQRRTQVKNR